MLEFRVAAAAGNLPELERLFSVYGDSLNINEPGSKSGKTTAHVAAHGSHFKVMYWLLKKELISIAKIVQVKQPLITYNKMNWLLQL